MAHSKNTVKFFKRLQKRTGCHAYGQKGGAYGCVAPHWLAYGRDLRPLRAIGPLGLAALMLQQRPTDDETETDNDPCDCPEPDGLLNHQGQKIYAVPHDTTRTFNDHSEADMDS